MQGTGPLEPAVRPFSVHLDPNVNPLRAVLPVTGPLVPALQGNIATTHAQCIAFGHMSEAIPAGNIVKRTWWAQLHINTPSRRLLVLAGVDGPGRLQCCICNPSGSPVLAEC